MRGLCASHCSCENSKKFPPGQDLDTDPSVAQAVPLSSKLVVLNPALSPGCINVGVYALVSAQQCMIL